MHNVSVGSERAAISSWLFELCAPPIGLVSKATKMTRRTKNKDDLVLVWRIFAFPNLIGLIWVGFRTVVCSLVVSVLVLLGILHRALMLILHLLA